MALRLQMLVRHFGYKHDDLYDFYNQGHPSYPNLPPPPNPTGLQTFMLACLEITIEQMREENGGDELQAEAKSQMRQRGRPARPPRRP